MHNEVIEAWFSRTFSRSVIRALEILYNAIQLRNFGLYISIVVEKNIVHLPKSREVFGHASRFGVSASVQRVSELFTQDCLDWSHIC